MTDEDTQGAEGTYHAQGFETFNVSEDGQTVQIVMAAGDGTIMLTLPTQNLPAFSANLRLLIDGLVMGGALPAGTDKQIRPVTVWGVARFNDPRMAKVTLLVFDKGLDQEAAVSLGDRDALALADAIEQQVFKGMSLVDQRELIKAVEDARGGGKGKPHLILPPGAR